jgi:hypothetical protein
VIDLADREAPSLYEGLARVLLESLGGNADYLLPADYRGSTEERMLEFVAEAKDPETLILEHLSPTQLSELARTGMEMEERPLDRRADARQILRNLGWDIPKPTGFSIESGTGELEKVLAKCRLARVDKDQRSAVLEAALITERSMKLSVSSWLRLAGRSGTEVLPAKTPQRKSLGDWKSDFVSTPKQLSSIDWKYRQTFDRVKRSLKRECATKKLDALMSLRNDVAHGRDLPSREEVFAAIDGVRELFDRLARNLVLPVVVEPQEERRDRYGRLTLVAEDGRGRTQEIFLSESIDLTRPLVWIPLDTNPRNVDPPLLDHDDAWDD